MSKEPKPFEFQLTQTEVDEIRNAAGEGGHQSFHRLVVSQLDEGSTVRFDDAQLGKLIRYMTQYKGGGFQSRLRSAFIRSLKNQLGI